MYRDEIIAEVWRNRDAYVKQHHHSLDEIVEDLRRREKRDPSEIVDRKRTRTTKPHRGEQDTGGALPAG